MEVNLILAVAEHCIVKPSEASYLAFIVKELKFYWIGKLALEAHYFCVTATIVLSSVLTERLMLT